MESSIQSFLYLFHYFSRVECATTISVSDSVHHTFSRTIFLQEIIYFGSVANYVHFFNNFLTAAHENTGERSSQYAAENSCRARYGPYSEWMASFDTGMGWIAILDSHLACNDIFVLCSHLFSPLMIAKTNT